MTRMDGEGGKERMNGKGKENQVHHPEVGQATGPLFKRSNCAWMGRWDCGEWRVRALIEWGWDQTGGRGDGRWGLWKDRRGS